LFLDVDGPLNPYGADAAHIPDGYETHWITPRGEQSPLPVRLNPAHGPRLLALAERVGLELVWATTWEHEANEAIGPRIGLPVLPVVEFGLRIHARLWKWAAVAEYAGTRPLAWLDDDFTRWQDNSAGFVAARYGIETLLIQVDPATGVVAPDLTAIESWAARLAPQSQRHA
jgi:hypothetical protein